MAPEFRAGERVRENVLVCTECGKRAEGNASWADGSGDLCDACVAADEAYEEDKATAGPSLREDQY